MRIQDIIRGIEPLDYAITEKAKRHTAELCMPPRALGKLHDIAESLCAIQRTLRPEVNKKGIIVMAADHGVARQGVSAFPQEVTCEMVKNFVRGGAGINALARQINASVYVVDMGVAGPLQEIEGENRLIRKNMGPGTSDFTKGPAMSRGQAEEAVLAGFDVAGLMFEDGVDLLGTGDMGIGNTTPSSAIGAVITGQNVEIMTGRGTGVDNAGLSRKCTAINTAIQLNKPDPNDGLDVLSKLGGFEIGGIAGLILAAAYHRKPVVIDGLISTAGALIAHKLCPLISQYAFAGHTSVEPGHKHMLDYLQLTPILNLGLRLGEGTGAALAMNVLEAACRVFNEVLTFSEAGVIGA